MRFLSKINSVKSGFIFLLILTFSFILLACSESQDETTSSTPTPTPSTTASTNTSDSDTFNKSVSDSILNAHLSENDGDNGVTKFAYDNDFEAYEASYSNEKGAQFQLDKDGQINVLVEPPADENEDSFNLSVGSKYCVNPDSNMNYLVTGAEQTDGYYKIWNYPDDQLTGLGLLWEESSCKDLSKKAFTVFGLTQNSSIICEELIYKDNGEILSQEYKTITNDSDPLWINFSNDSKVSCDFYKPSG